MIDKYYITNGLCEHIFRPAAGTHIISHISRVNIFFEFVFSFIFLKIYHKSTFAFEYGENTTKKSSVGKSQKIESESIDYFF